MREKLFAFLKRDGPLKRRAAQHSVHPTSGSLRDF